MRTKISLFILFLSVALLIGFLTGIWVQYGWSVERVCVALGWDTGGAGFFDAGICRQETESGHALECPYSAVLDGTCLPLLEMEGVDG